MANVVEWAKLLNRIYNKENAICPECGGEVKCAVYSNDAKIGFAILDCDSCKEHIKLSRITIPEGMETIKF